MNKVTYDSFTDVYKRLEKAGIVSSSQIIRRAINGYYTLKDKPNPKDVYIHENGIEEKLDDAK